MDAIPAERLRFLNIEYLDFEPHESDGVALAAAATGSHPFAMEIRREFPRLTQLCMSGSDLAAEGRLCPRLRELTLSYSRIESLDDLPESVERLHVRNCDKLTDEAILAVVNRKPNLRRIEVSGDSVRAIVAPPGPQARHRDQVQHCLLFVGPGGPRLARGLRCAGPANRSRREISVVRQRLATGPARLEHHRVGHRRCGDVSAARLSRAGQHSTPTSFSPRCAFPAVRFRASDGIGSESTSCPWLRQPRPATSCASSPMQSSS